MADKLKETRASWNAATLAHNSHKRDQAAFLRAGGSTLFADELALLGDLGGKRLLHTLCNAGQDTLSLAALGANVTGIDMSDEAIAFATSLSRDSGIAGTFERSEAIAWLEGADARTFDVVFGSYGCLGWIEDLPRFMRGVKRRLVDGGRAVFLEFHPLVWSFDAAWKPKDPYFAPGRVFSEPVGDYVAQAGPALAPSGFVEGEPAFVNPHVAHGYQQTVGDIVQSVIDAGLTVQVVREYPYSNGCRIHEGFVDVGDNRFAPPAPVSLPCMLGVVAAR